MASSKFNFSWHHTMLRVKEPSQSISFYQKYFGMTLIDKYDFNERNFSLYFLAILPEGSTFSLQPGSDEAHTHLWHFKGTLLELTHIHGTENDQSFKYDNGNVEPHRGFGHLAFVVDDVYQFCENLEKNNVKFQKKPDDGRMKGLAFALDPDGYWLEIIKRRGGSLKGVTLNQTMLRIKDPKKSLAFYCDLLGLTLLCERHFPDAKFSLYFLGKIPMQGNIPSPETPEAFEMTTSLFDPVLELTHNHGTESDPQFAYHNGNSEPKGFGHIGFLTDDIDATIDELEKKGVPMQKKPNEGNMKRIAFVRDPDNYWVEFVPRDIKF